MAVIRATLGKKEKKDYEHLKTGKVSLCLYTVYVEDYWLFSMNVSRPKNNKT